MSFSFKRAVLLGLIALVAAAGLSRAQSTSDNTPTQRITVMTDKLDRMKRSLGSAISTLRQESGAKKEDEKNIATPIGRLVALAKDLDRVSADVSSLRGKLDRQEKYDNSQLESLEASVNEMQTRVESAQTDTAALRAASDASVSKPKDDKKGGGKFLGLFGGVHKDE
ncbi:MAG TPA: hypothetical protein VGI80_02935, partial [Pyrinomonadaceae bacterium]